RGRCRARAATHDGARALQRLRRAHADAADRVRHPLLLRSALERIREGAGQARGHGTMTETAAFRVIHARVPRRRDPASRWYRRPQGAALRAAGSAGPPAAAPARPRRTRGAALSAAGIVSFIAAWQIGADAGLIDKFFFSSPTDILAAGVGEVEKARLVGDVKISAIELGLGTLIALVTSVPIGIAIG